MNWTIACNGVEKSPANWGVAHLTRKLVSQGVDELAFRATGSASDSPPAFPHGAMVVLSRNRSLDSGGGFSGGTPWFQGIVTQVPRLGAPDTEGLAYKVAGPWWYLENLVFHQPYQNVFLGFSTPGNPNSTPIYGPAHSSHLFLNQAPITGFLARINTGRQIIDALNWALKPFTDALAAPPFQIGAVTPALDVPIDEVRDITCAQVIHKMLRWSPDAVTWFDYTTSPPTFNCKRRADMTTVNLDISRT